ncbi:MAG TPA: 2-amino-4-hydroxy-6-hydroxymethyldihydropteridine diphosphokinase, partial [Blastocatellia bacterium]|nr:2-amino-4-hydroxy-6-hydroxymethyldihydropteridine diphosphokinase [Blastocatellia bacterium]
MINGVNRPGSNIAGESAFFGLGSNLGDRRANLREAIRRIEALGIAIVRESSVYETEPVGCLDQPWFLNQVVEARIEEGSTLREAGDADPVARRVLQASSLLDALLGIERDMGRKRVIASGPRVIDIDILLMGSSIIAQTRDEAGGPRVARAEIIVPHPR